MEEVQNGSRLGQMLAWCEAHDASDLHGQAERPYFTRIHGRLERMPTETFPIPNSEDFDIILAQAFSKPTHQRIRAEHEVDLSFHFDKQRYRANFSKQKGLQSFSLRQVPQHRLKFADLQLPSSLREVIRQPRGLVLATGPTGQGKSTTLRALIQEINETQPARIITIEDPIEYVFEEDQCQFEQREVGIDTESFAQGIRNAMRQDPNVIFVGEIRDKESIFAAMQAAETGHLVLTTLHADSVAQAVGRIREYYPTLEQGNISSLLARNTNTIICQRLLPNTQGTRTPCLEILKRDAGIQAAIQSNELHLLTGIVEAAVGQGMHSFDQYLVELLAEGIITEETARQYAVNKHRLDMTLRGIITTSSILQPDR